MCAAEQQRAAAAEHLPVEPAARPAERNQQRSERTAGGRSHRAPPGERGHTEEPDSGHMICFFHEVFTVVQLI